MVTAEELSGADVVLGCSEEGAVIEPSSPSDIPLSLLYKPQHPGAAALPHRWDCRKGVLGCAWLSTVALLHQVQTVQVLQVPSVLRGRNSSVCV